MQYALTQNKDNAVLLWTFHAISAHPRSCLQAAVAKMHIVSSDIQPLVSARFLASGHNSCQLDAGRQFIFLGDGAQESLLRESFLTTCGQQRFSAPSGTVRSS